MFENYGSWSSFLSIGNSSKMVDGFQDQSKIGNKCQGSKLCLAARKMTCVISKSDKDEKWGFCPLYDPYRSHLAKTDELCDPKNKVYLLNKETIMKFLTAKGPMVEEVLTEIGECCELEPEDHKHLSKCMSIVREIKNLSKKDELHWDQFTESMVKNFLDQDSGLFLLIIGHESSNLCEDLKYFNQIPWQQLEEDEYEEALAGIKQQNFWPALMRGTTVLAKSSIHAYLLLNTLIGNPFTYRRLKSGGFQEQDILKVVEDLKKAQQLDEQLLVEEPSNETGLAPEIAELPIAVDVVIRLYSPNKKNPPAIAHKDGIDILQTVNDCFPFIPMSIKDKVADKHTTDIEKVSIITKKTKARWQDRHIASFEASAHTSSGKRRYVVAIAVDGRALKQGHYYMLNRKGGKRDAQTRSGYHIDAYMGFLFYSKGNFVKSQKDMIPERYLKAMAQDGSTEELDFLQQMDVYKYLCQKEDGLYLSLFSKFLRQIDEQSSMHHLQIFINGNFDQNLDFDRNDFDSEGLDDITSLDFVKNLCAVFDTFRMKSSTFREYLKQLKESGKAIIALREERAYERRIQDLMSNEVWVLKFPAEFRKRESLFFIPDAGNMRENHVLSIYSEIVSHLPNEFPKSGFPTPQGVSSQEWETFWPTLSYTSGGLGIDCKGFEKSREKQIVSLVKNLGADQQEKLQQEKKATKSFKKTLQQIATPKNMFDIEFKSIFSNLVQFNHPLRQTDYIICWSFKDLGEETIISDKHGVSGRIMSKVDDHDGAISIPEVLRGHAFFISDLSINDGNTPVDREYSHRNFIILIALKGLIQETFVDNLMIVDLK